MLNLTKYLADCIDTTQSTSTPVCMRTHDLGVYKHTIHCDFTVVDPVDMLL